MLTTIGIIVIILGLIGFYLVNALAITKTAKLTVVGDISNERPLKVLRPGFKFLLWPFRRKKATLSTSIDTYNVESVTINCLVHDQVSKEQSNHRQDALGELKTKEISLAWQIHFWNIFELSDEDRTSLRGKGINLTMSQQLTKLFELDPLNADGSMNLTKIKERLKDLIHTELAMISQTLQLHEGINFAKAANPETGAPAVNHMKTVEKRLRMACLELQIPVRIIALDKNAPFEPLGAAGEAIKKRAALAVEVESKLLEEETKLRVARVAVQTEEVKGDALVVRLNKLAAAYGLTTLPPAEQLRAKLDLETLAVYRELSASGNSKFVIMPDMLGKIGSALKAITGG